jgi:general stress protein 26
MNDTSTTSTSTAPADPADGAPLVPGDAPSPVLSWADVVSGCADLGGGVYLASVGADGRPHVAWVSVGYGDECLWFSTFGDSQKVKNLRHATAVSMHWPERGDRLAFARGTARLVTDRAESDQLWDDGVLPYDPAAFFSGKDDPLLQFVQVVPRRVTFRSLFEPTAPPRVWTPSA